MVSMKPTHHFLANQKVRSSRGVHQGNALENKTPDLNIDYAIWESMKPYRNDRPPSDYNYFGIEGIMPLLEALVWDIHSLPLDDEECIYKQHLFLFCVGFIRISYRKRVLDVWEEVPPKAVRVMIRTAG
jgi:hypothetical protein